MNKKIGLMFAGQGAQTTGMGKDLFDAYPEAAEVFVQADAVLNRRISDLCFNGSMEELTSCANCQPAIFTVSMACLAALKSRIPDFTPAICAGLSLGEYAALTAAGVFNCDDALNLVAKRGQLMDEACQNTRGSMAAVFKMEISDVEDICRKHNIDIANYNSAGQQIISGLAENVAAAVADLTAAGRTAKMLTVAGAYHSRLMEPAAQNFAQIIKNIKPSRPNCPVVQNITGEITEDTNSITDNLIAQISGSVQWEKCALEMMKHCDILLELGPGKVLSGLAKRINRDFPVYNICDVATLDAFINA